MILTSSCHYWHKFDDSLVHRSAAQILLRQNFNSNDKTVSESFLLQNFSWVSSLRNILKNQECKIGTYGKCGNSRFLSIDMQYQRELERGTERERRNDRETERQRIVDMSQLYLPVHDTRFLKTNTAATNVCCSSSLLLPPLSANETGCSSHRASTRISAAQLSRTTRTCRWSTN